jgi:hypothetical protein
MLRLKSLALTFDKHFDYILFADDDLIYLDGAEEYFANIIKILKEKKPDVLNLFGKSYPSEYELNPQKCLITNNRGLFIKVVKLKQDLEWYNDVIILKGGTEDVVLGYKALENNGDLIVVGGAPVEIRFEHVLSGDSSSPIHNSNIIDENVNKFIRKRYNDPDWILQTWRFPKNFRTIETKVEPLTQQVGGNHYSKLAIQPVEYCFHNKMPAIESSVIKYVTRHNDKDGAKDIKKAIHLLNILLKLQYGEVYENNN